MVNAWKVSNTFNSSVCLDPYFGSNNDSIDSKLLQSMTVSYGRSYTQNNINLSFNAQGGLKAPNKHSNDDKKSSPIKASPITLGFNTSW